MQPKIHHLVAALALSVPLSQAAPASSETSPANVDTELMQRIDLELLRRAEQRIGRDIVKRRICPKGQSINGSLIAMGPFKFFSPKALQEGYCERDLEGEGLDKREGTKPGISFDYKRPCPKGQNINWSLVMMGPFKFMSNKALREGNCEPKGRDLEELEERGEPEGTMGNIRQRGVSDLAKAAKFFPDAKDKLEDLKLGKKSKKGKKRHHRSSLSIPKDREWTKGLHHGPLSLWQKYGGRD